MTRLIARVAAVLVLLFVVSSSPAAAQGIKFGPTFATFSSEALDFDSRTGIHAGLFVGGSAQKILSFQAEFNWVRKKAGAEDGPNIRIDYIQLPALLRLNAGSSSANGFRVYGIGGPAVSFKIADEVEGFTLDDGFEGADVSLVFGGGFEVARIIVEGRYDKGFRRINKRFSELTEIKTEAFTILFGLRFR
jgi:hypothetical protein